MISFLDSPSFLIMIFIISYVTLLIVAKNKFLVNSIVLSVSLFCPILMAEMPILQILLRLDHPLPVTRMDYLEHVCGLAKKSLWEYPTRAQGPAAIQKLYCLGSTIPKTSSRGIANKTLQNVAIYNVWDENPLQADCAPISDFVNSMIFISPL